MRSLDALKTRLTDIHEKLQEKYSCRLLATQPSYHFAPTQEIPVIVQIEDARHIKKRHWGLVPFWAKDISIGSRLINARAETKDIHDRMPLILQPETYDEWLDPAKRDSARVEGLLRTMCVKGLKYYPAAKLVNRVENNSKECMGPYKESGG